MQTSPDVVIVPGGGLLPDGNLPLWVRNRFDLAIQQAQGGSILALSAGTPHKAPPLDQRRRPILEAIAGARYLVSCGFPPAKILTETASWDTIGNAYFARTIHTDPAHLRRIHVITSAFHMARTEAVFRWVFTLAPITQPYQLEFTSVPDVGMDNEVLAVRRAKEQDSLSELRKNIPQYQTMQSFHQWLFSQHGAYAVDAQAPSLLPDPLLEKSY